jgi:hypothetical protein
MPGALWYPPASRVQDFSNTYTGALQKPNVLLLHSTEGTSWPSYDGGASAPHLTYDRKGAKGHRWRQHFPFNRGARALMNLPGGVETNSANVVQVELIGTCNPPNKDKPGWLWVPGMDDEMIHDIARLWAWLNQEWPIPLTSTLRWLPYPSSYGNTAVRLTASEWWTFTGLCGHQHAPENTHGDPGDIPHQKILARAKFLRDGGREETTMTRGERVDDAIKLLVEARGATNRPGRRRAIDKAIKSLRELEQRKA